MGSSTSVKKETDKQKVLRLLKEKRNIFITGGGGVGKSYLLKELCELRDITVTSTTGISALNVGGQTVHSWSGIGTASKSINEIVASIKKNKTRLYNIESTDILAIDEISMLDDFTLDYLNQVLKNVLQSNKPFGGLQVILIGDFFQLPPVQLGNNRDFCFNSKTWQELNLEIINLKKVYRQDDEQLITALNNIREGDISSCQIFASRNFVEPSEDCVRLYATNEEVNNYNKLRFDAIKKPAKKFYSQDIIKCWIDGKKKDLKPNDPKVPDWDKAIYNTFNNSCKAPSCLELKQGCRVMLLQNIDVEGGLVNGSCGNVLKLTDFDVTVKFDNGRTFSVEKADFEYCQYGFVKVKRTQFPLALSYAVSIHKSQGMTFDKVFIDFSRIFTFGQAYVALSRVKSLLGLFIKNFNPLKIKANPSVINFYKNL